MIIRIHNTGDPYKLPTLSVHTRASVLLLLSPPLSPRLSLLARSFFPVFPFLPFSSFPALVLAAVSWQPPPGSPVSGLLFSPSRQPTSLSSLLSFYLSLSLSLSLLARHRHCGTYPTVRCSRTMALFLHLIPDLARLTLSRLSFPVSLPSLVPCTLHGAFWHRCLVRSRPERRRERERESSARKRVTPEASRWKETARDRKRWRDTARRDATRRRPRHTCA